MIPGHSSCTEARGAGRALAAAPGRAHHRERCRGEWQGPVRKLRDTRETGKRTHEEQTQRRNENVATTLKCLRRESQFGAQRMSTLNADVTENRCLYTEHGGRSSSCTWGGQKGVTYVRVEVSSSIVISRRVMPKMRRNQKVVHT